LAARKICFPWTLGAKFQAPSTKFQINEKFQQTEFQSRDRPFSGCLENWDIGIYLVLGIWDWVLIHSSVEPFQKAK
jgi:hypothetical protein